MEYKYHTVFDIYIKKIIIKYEGIESYQKYQGVVLYKKEWDIGRLGVT